MEWNGMEGWKKSRQLFGGGIVSKWAANGWAKGPSWVLLIRVESVSHQLLLHRWVEMIRQMRGSTRSTIHSSKLDLLAAFQRYYYSTRGCRLPAIDPRGMKPEGLEGLKGLDWV